MSSLPAIAILLALAPACLAGEWLTFGHDPQRTGWAFAETQLSPANVSALVLKWKAKVQNAS